MGDTTVNLRRELKQLQLDNIELQKEIKLLNEEQDALRKDLVAARRDAKTPFKNVSNRKEEAKKWDQ